jgi:hypothetical protein
MQIMSNINSSLSSEDQEEGSEEENSTDKIMRQIGV